MSVRYIYLKFKTRFYVNKINNLLAKTNKNIRVLYSCYKKLLVGYDNLLKLNIPEDTKELILANRSSIENLIELIETKKIVPVTIK